MTRLVRIVALATAALVAVVAAGAVTLRGGG